MADWVRVPASYGFGDEPATDEDWPSPGFDHVQPLIANYWLNPGVRMALSWAEREAEAERWRQRLPYVVASIRQTLGEPKWDPRGATVTRIGRCASEPTP